MTPRQISELPAYFYRTAGGAEPVLEWLRGLPVEDRRVIGTDLAMVQFGWPIGMPLFRPLRGGLWEVRSNLPTRRIARVVFFIDAGRIGVVHGFIKKTQAMANEDMEIARVRVIDARAYEGDEGMSTQSPHWGTPVDEFLAEDGIRETAKAEAITRVVAWQLAQEMERQGISKMVLAERMGTSRAQLDRILKAKGNVTMETLQRAAAVVGRELRVELVERR